LRDRNRAADSIACGFLVWDWIEVLGKAARCAVFASFFVVAAPAMAETLQSVVRKTLATNPDLKALQFNRQAIDQELEAAKGLGLPSVDIRAAAGHRSTETSVLPGGSSRSRRDRNRAEAGVAVSQRLFDGYETKSQVLRQTERVNSARSRVSDTANSIALQTTQAFLELQRTSQVRAIADQNVKAHETLLGKVKARSDGGRGASSEVSQAQARLQAAKASRVEADARHKDAVSLYIAVVGVKPPVKLTPGPAPVKRLPKSVDSAVAQAQKGAPAIIARMFDASAATAAIAVAKSEFYPKITAELSADYAYDVDRTYGRRAEASAMVVYRQNLYRGGVDSARVREAQARASEAQATADVMRRTVEREVRLSWTAMHAARMRAEIIGRQLEQNKTVIAAYKEQFELGQRTLLDILDIQNEMFVNATTRTTETFVSEYNVYRVLAAMGQLIPAIGADYPEDAKRPPLPSGAIIP
jgi:outer membrane protein, adhesin transport system